MRRNYLLRKLGPVDEATTIDGAEPRAVRENWRQLLERARVSVASAAACGMASAFASSLGNFPASGLLVGAEPLTAMAVVVPFEVLVYAFVCVLLLMEAPSAARQSAVLARMPWCPVLTTVVAIAPSAVGRGALLAESRELGFLYLLFAFVAPIAVLLRRETRRLWFHIRGMSIADRYGHWVWPVTFAAPAVIVAEAATWGVNYGSYGGIKFANVLLVASLAWLF